MRLIVSVLLILITQQALSNPIVLQDTPLKEFVSWYSKQTNQTILIKDGVNVSLNAYAPKVPDTALEEFFISLLSAHDLELVKQNSNKIIQPIKQEPLELDNEEDKDEEDLKIVVYPLDNVLADDLESFATIFTNQKENKNNDTRQVYVIRSLNALALNTTEEQQNAFSKLLPFIDTARPLVFLEAIIFEETSGKGLDLGVSYGNSPKLGDSLEAGFNLSNLNELNQTGFSFGILSDENLTFALNAIENNSQVKILSTPKILIISGEEGVISVGQNVPFIASTILNNGNTTQSIERRDVGVSLTVKPFVTQEDTIMLNLGLTADSINQSLKATDIITNTRNLRTSVILKSGESLNLGGLVTSEEEEQVKKIPFLGSIPFLGALFRSTSTSTTEKELNIILQAKTIN